jgi:hypothetical protein
MKELTENDLTKIKWVDMVIRKIPTGDYALIFVFETEDNANIFLDIIHDNPFYLKAEVNKDRKYFLTFDFKNSDYCIQYPTNKTEKDEIDYKLFKTENIKCVTAGTLPTKLENGEVRRWVSKRLYTLGDKIALN